VALLLRLSSCRQCNPLCISSLGVVLETHYFMIKTLLTRITLNYTVRNFVLQDNILIKLLKEFVSCKNLSISENKTNISNWNCSFHLGRVGESPHTSSGINFSRTRVWRITDCFFHYNVLFVLTHCFPSCFLTMFMYATFISIAEVKECVELHLHSPNTPSWHGS
jgi:hypothetical protein